MKETMKKLICWKKDFIRTKCFARRSIFIGVFVLLMGFLVAINLLVGKMDIKVDMTKNKVYTISSKSKDYVKTIKDKVKITTFLNSDAESSGEEGVVQIKSILSEYKKCNNLISVNYVDPDKDQVTVQKYSSSGSQVGNGTVVVESGNRIKIINIYEMFGSDPSSGVAISRVEQNITSAINYVVNGKTTNVCCLRGHQETPLQNFYQVDQLMKYNYTINDLNLLAVKDVPSDTNVILVLNPRVDIGTSERAKLERYLASGGRMLVCLEPKTELPQFAKLFSAYNVTLVNDFVVENNSSRHIYGRPTFLVESVNSTDVTQSTSSTNLNVILFGSRSFKLMSDANSNVTTYALVQSSDNSWGRTDFSDVSLTKSNSDIMGPLDLVVAAQRDDNKTQKRSRIIIFGDCDFISDQLISEMGAGGNIEIFMNSLKWVCERQDVLNIEAKTVNWEPFTLTGTQAMWVLIIVAAIPLAIAIIGIVIWVRRRRL